MEKRPSPLEFEKEALKETGLTRREFLSFFGKGTGVIGLVGMIDGIEKTKTGISDRHILKAGTGIGETILGTAVGAVGGLVWVLNKDRITSQGEEDAPSHQVFPSPDQKR